VLLLALAVTMLVTMCMSGRLVLLVGAVAAALVVVVSTARVAGLVAEQAATAARELPLEGALAGMHRVWGEETTLELAPYKGGRFTVLRGVDRVAAQLEDHQVQLAAMRGGPHYGAFAAQLDGWDEALSLVAEVTELLMRVTRAWRTLEAIFGAVFIAQGFERAAQCVVRVFDTALREGQVLENRKDPKTSLQEWLQARRWPTPIYTIVATTGLAHAQTFEVRVEVPGFAGQALGRGPTRRAAEQAAAADLLPRLAADPAFQGVKPRPKEKPLR
jgi:hypothetical protein